MALLVAMAQAMGNDSSSKTEGDAAAAAAARSDKRAELKAQAMAKISEHPDLVRDFEQFQAASRAMSLAVNAS